jgi:hypothetical protein
MTFLASAHLGRGIKSIYEMRAPIGQIPLFPVIRVIMRIMRFEVLTMVKLMMLVFWVLVSCGLVGR